MFGGKQLEQIWQIDRKDVFLQHFLWYDCSSHFPDIFHLFYLQFLCRIPYIFDKYFSASDFFSRVYLFARDCGCW